MLKTELIEILGVLGWTQADLAHKIGVSQNTVSRWREVPGPVAAYADLVYRVYQFSDGVLMTKIGKIKKD